MSDSVAVMTQHNTSTIRSWFAGRLPAEWAGAGEPELEIDRDEITVTIAVDAPALDDDATDVDRAEAIEGRIAGFREDTRDRRVAIAREAEHRFERKVAWAVRVGDRTELFTHLAAPVMTRLRQPERRVLDTLVAANVARSRADALAWCVRLVGRHTDDWLSELRGALQSVDEIRDSGPDAA
jgi:HSP20 family molecular chaperone IbpA